MTFTRYQKFIIATLAFLQFTVVLDFMILSPLGAILMPELGITPTQFGLVVSAYAFSAGASGFLSAGFADRFDRKKLLLFFYTGFVLGTLFCALAPTYHLLLAARMLTGIFGGVIGSIVLAITTDLFPFESRGRVMGILQSAFAGSQVLGIPTGLYLATRWNWHMPFFMIVAVSVIVGAVIFIYLKPIDGHLGKQSKENPFRHLLSTITETDYLYAFGTTALLATGGFMLMPFTSAYNVHNLGISLQDLPMMFMIVGLTTIGSGPLIGISSDRLGKYKVFMFGSVLSFIMVYYYTHLGTTSVTKLVIVNSILFLGIFSRMIPSQALMSAIPSPEKRGAFMSITASIQQVSGGIASAIAGMIIVVNPDGSLGNFPILGYVIICAGLITWVFMHRIQKKVVRKT